MARERARSVDTPGSSSTPLAPTTEQHSPPQVTETMRTLASGRKVQSAFKDPVFLPPWPHPRPPKSPVRVASSPPPSPSGPTSVAMARSRASIGVYQPPSTAAQSAPDAPWWRKKLGGVLGALWEQPEAVNSSSTSQQHYQQSQELTAETQEVKPTLSISTRRRSRRGSSQSRKPRLSRDITPSPPSPPPPSPLSLTQDDSASTPATSVDSLNAGSPTSALISATVASTISPLKQARGRRSPKSPLLVPGARSASLDYHALKGAATGSSGGPKAPPAPAVLERRLSDILLVEQRAQPSRKAAHHH